MTTFPDYPSAPIEGPPDEHRRQIAQVANLAIQGKTRNVGEITLTENAASSTLTDGRLSFFSVVLFDPLTSNAAAELYGGTMYVTEANRDNGSWTITHANNAQTDRDFRYVIIG